jgi:hypothetical protein
VADAVAPASVEYCPRKQSPEQATGSPFTDEKLPGMQGRQTAESVAARTVEYRPEAHSAHELDAERPKLEAYDPAAHALHVAEAAAPDAVEYFPAEHSEHAPDAVSPDPVAYAPAKQRLHAADDVAPGAVEYCPAPHSDMHADVSPDADA